MRAVAPPVPTVASELQLATEELGLVVIGGGEESLDLIRATRELLDARGLDIPILFAGRMGRRTDAEDAGADEVVARPAYLRDVVTIGRLLNGIPAEQRIHIIGNLGELTNVFTLVRALSALGRSATLTLMRGLRRGEVRFFHGEVTSAQVGLIHGQAALHQLLLWTDARFDFHHEDVVRRQQIPLSHDELFADAERFLEGIKESSGPLSPSMVLEQNVARLHSLGKQIPTEVHGVLRMFDGHRVLADVLEDSPYRVFETLRVSQRALEAGLLRVVQNQRPKATWRAVLSIEEWLVGSDRDGSVDRGAPELESGPVSGPASGPTGPDSKLKLPPKKRRNRKHRRANTPLPIAKTMVASDSGSGMIDWGALVPRIIGADVGTLAGVVPAAQLSGEIQTPSREIGREKLEALMDTGKRDRIFPKDIGLEPSVVFDDTSGPVHSNGANGASAGLPELAMPRTATGKVRDDAQLKVRELVKHQQTERTVADLDARSRRELEARSAGDSKARLQLEAEVRARQEAEVAVA
ncbi:MAG: DUF4388 domain-containing protein, partial [Deltaproteobacteria bacterium]|nr:DUF4388 domain-containing protein [Deltaproteobacteria bacterium]